MTSKFISYKNSKVHFTDSGTGLPIILIHGFLETVSVWNDLTPLLQNTYRVISIDLPGHGKSDGLGELHSMEEMAIVANAIIENIEIEKAIFLGHSMGGYVCLAYAELFPEKVKGLGLINSTPLADSTEKKQKRERAIDAVRNNYKTFARITIPSLFAEKNKIRLKREIDKLINNTLKMTSENIIATIKGMKIRKDRTSVFLDGSFKKLLLIGEDDPVIKVSELQRIVGNQSEIGVVIPGGHMSFLENFNDFSYAIMYFIEK